MSLDGRRVNDIQFVTVDVAALEQCFGIINGIADKVPLDDGRVAEDVGLEGFARQHGRVVVQLARVGRKADCTATIPEPPAPPPARERKKRSARFHRSS